MKQFYLTRLAMKPAEERQAYLDAVPARFRDEVREAWNGSHPDEVLD